MRIRFALWALLLPVSAAAQEPLSAIEWLNKNPPPDGGPVLLEPPVSKTALYPRIDVSTLKALALPIGLVPADVTGLPVTLWVNSDPDVLIRLIDTVPVRNSPAMQTLLYSLLLSDSIPPEGTKAAEGLLLARIDRLLDLGATDPAKALVEQANPLQTPALFRRWFDTSLLTGDEDQTCTELLGAPHLAPGYGARIFCTARRGDWQTAALTLEAAHSLDLLSRQELDLLDRFLSPDVFEGAPPLPVPADPDPLTFRLFEAIGERLPTASLPRAFATADLRDVAGWKAQLEAAERLTRVGALSPNQLLGLYTDRQPSASGGIWDRVRAIQRFDTALQTRSPAAVAKTLPAAWVAMRTARLEVPFAALFAEDLSKLALGDTPAADLAWRIQLLSPIYPSVSPEPAQNSPINRFLIALAQGDPTRVPAPNAMAVAIAEAFTPDAAAPPRAVDQQDLGETILRAMREFDSGASGNLDDLSQSLATFRAVGLDDTARRAALQLILLSDA